MAIFFTSDNHWYDSNIIKLGKRPFTSVEEMNETLIERWNSVVKNTDTIWCLGDMAFRNKNGQFGKVFSRLNGIKHLVIGNHDDKDVINQAWASTQDLKEIVIDGKHITLCHYPMRSWNRMYRGSFHLYGHEHGNLFDYSNCLDVGVDRWNYYPASYEQVLERLTNTGLTRWYADRRDNDHAPYKSESAS